MAISLPTEVQNAKDKIGISPILLILFSDLSVYIASQECSIDTGSSTIEFDDSLKNGNALNLHIGISQLINDISSTGELTINILDYRATYRSSIIGSSPDLTDSLVEVYIKFGMDTDLLSNAVKLFTGNIATYSERRDVLSIKIKIPFPSLGIIPDTKTEYPVPQSPIARPLQYGNFNYSNDPRFWGDRYHCFAACPLTSWNESSGMARYWIADHQMDTLPSSVWTSYYDAYAFVARDNKFLHVKFPTSGTFTNSSSGAYLDIAIAYGTPTQRPQAWLFLPPTAPASGNNSWNHTYCYDGQSSTEAYIDSIKPKLSVGGPYGTTSLRTCELYSASYNNFILHVRFGGIDCDDSDIRVRVTNGTHSADTMINYTYASDWHSFPFPTECDELNELEEYWIEIEGVGATFVDCYVKEILIGVRMQDVTEEDDFLYLRCIGREFSGTWGSRKTTGNAINYFPEIVESILRDEYAYGDSDIDTTTFDAINTYFSGQNIYSACTIFEQDGGENILREMCKMFNCSLIYSTQKKWRLIYPHPSAMSFTQSGTNTPGNEDIFTDTDLITAGEYTQHPILHSSFHLSRTSEARRYTNIILNHIRLHTGDYIRQNTYGSSGNMYVINNYALAGHVQAAANFLASIDGWIATQKFVIEFETFYNAIAIEPGDVINVRHNDLTGSMLYTGNVNTQKWIVVDVSISWRPNTIKIKAVECRV